MKYWFIYFIFMIQTLFAFTLREKFEQGEPGSYTVTQQNELVSLLHLHSKNNHTLLFEEISIPLHQAKNVNWREWIQKGAPGHTSWILYEIDTEKNYVTEAYSLTRKAWIPTDEINAFLIPLISLELNFLSKEKRLQKGATAKPGNIDSKPWGPPQVKNGKTVKNPEYNVYTAKWPRDSTDFSGKQIVLYFDMKEDTFPFPYWLQARDGAIKFKIRALDSGTGLISPCSDIPRRQIVFNPTSYRDNGKLCLSLNAPTYYDPLELQAIDTNQDFPLTYLVPFEERRNKENLSLLIDENTMKNLFKPGHQYVWVAISSQRETKVESPYLFIYTDEGDER